MLGAQRTAIWMGSQFAGLLPLGAAVAVAPSFFTSFTSLSAEKFEVGVLPAVGLADGVSDGSCGRGGGTGAGASSAGAGATSTRFAAAPLRFGAIHLQSSGTLSSPQNSLGFRARCRLPQLYTHLHVICLQSSACEFWNEKVSLSNMHMPPSRGR
jgi:hypothetical protein